MRNAGVAGLNLVKQNRLEYSETLEKVNWGDVKGDLGDSHVIPSYIIHTFSDEPERLVGAGVCMLENQMEQTTYAFHGEYFGLDTQQLKEHVADSAWLQHIRLLEADGQLDSDSVERVHVLNDWSDADRAWTSSGYVIKPHTSSIVRRLPRDRRGQWMCVVMVVLFIPE